MGDTAPPAGGPLHGIRVVELASFMAVPFGTMMLSDLGAEVVKVEPPRGDPFRRFGKNDRGASPVFLSSNRGKRSIVLDLKEASGRESFVELLHTADILVSSFRPAVLTRLGLDDALLAASNPRLIRLYLTGYGDGPLSDAPAFDVIIQARTGYTEMQGDHDHPALAPSYVVDKISSTMVCQATLAALLARERFGVADRVDLAMLDASVYVNFPDVMANRVILDQEPPEARNAHAATARPIRAQDGWIVIAPVTGGQIRRGLAAAGAPPDVAEGLLAIKDATTLTASVYDAFEARTPEHPVAHWMEVLAAADVPVAPCLGIDEHLADPELATSELYAIDDWGDGLGPTRHVRYPARFSTWGHLRASRGAPALGADAGELRP
jgi:crotonobetainyl-CoA:carnitine CoA-transferase CaiB-like acyl-CoA transferase